MVTLLACTIAALSLVPFLSGYLLRWILRTVGRHLRKQSAARRELVLQRVRVEHEHLSSKLQSSTRVDDDEDWERVESDPIAGAFGGDIATDTGFAGVIGFFHPFCNAGGGGERVLWAAIRATQRKWPKAVCVVYCGDQDVQKAAMIERVYHSFGISLHAPTVVFLYLSTRHLVQASRYPRFTLLGQSLASLIVAYDAFGLLVPDVFVDTMGYAFALAFAKYLFPDMPVGAYVHYPIISTDMLGSLDDVSGGQGVNAGAGSGFRGKVKKQYWHWFARLYGWVGSHVDVVMCNSTWTQGHIAALWKSKSLPNPAAKVVYPPCPVEEMEAKIEVSLESEKKRNHQILYIAQFRPEKNHALVLRSFAAYLHQLPSGSDAPRLVLIGSVRSNAADELHIYKLRLQAHELSIDNHTDFITDSPYSTVLQYLQTASIGTNGMWNEHFGIGVVEYLASGLIPVVHNSGGPKLDIVKPYDGERTGYHAETAQEFADAFLTVFGLRAEERYLMRVRARKQARIFTEEAFAQQWIEQLGQLVGKVVYN